MALFEQLQKSIELDLKKQNELKQAVEEGIEFFNNFNDSRMELAFSLFSEDMRKALFEVIFFLHVNDPKHEEHTFISTRIEKVHGVPKEVEYEETVSLYVENAPAGVVGIGELSPIFRDQFDKFIHTEMDSVIFEVSGFAPIYSIASLGSIGTVSHKQTASDLDLQVQYELEPFLFNKENLSDEQLKHKANQLITFFTNKFRIIKKFKREELKKHEVKKQLLKSGHQNFKTRFPMTYEVIIQGKRAVLQAVLHNEESKQKLAHELISMVKLHSKICLKKERSEKEKLLKDKIKRIQNYVQKKYPKAEVYLFSYSNDDYRAGKHGTTLESKEASGSAYELILNYEVLMPGIQFSPMIPIHFLMPPSVNANQTAYEQLTDYIRFSSIDIYDRYRSNLVDLGATPPLTSDYMTAHSGAVYWESFKASSGNLPKATLNLLRLEMLFDPRFNVSVIELIKDPKRFDKYAGSFFAADIEKGELESDDDIVELNEIDDFYDDYGLEVTAGKKKEELEEDEVLGEEDYPGGLPIEEIFKIEKKYPSLHQDPWWLRYKALKIGFGPENKRITEQKEKDLISRIIDLGFALHMKISDIFVSIREKSKLESYREKVLALFLKKAFPVSKRRFLEHISNGEVGSVINFERDLKFLFERSMQRIQKFVSDHGGEDQTNQEENKIWFHYYEKNFNPPNNVIRRDILTDLKVPRGRLQVGINNKRKWFFRSIQKSTLAESRYDTFGMLEHLPDEVDLFEHGSFLHGIAHCILNGYYGVLNKGTLRESRTHLEYSVGHTEIGKASADKWAYIRPDIVDRLVDSIDRAFPPQEFDFRDCIYKEKEIVNVFICLNLLEYGRVSFMYRDNLKTWYVDEIDHPTVERQAQEMYQNPEMLFESSEIQDTIKQFFEDNKIDIHDPGATGISFWINPNSLHTHHPADKFSQKEQELARDYRNMITS